jgi:hypothetical protein
VVNADRWWAGALWEATRAHALSAKDALVLSDGYRATIALPEARLVARVARDGQGLDGLQAEIDFALLAAGHDLPVLAPAEPLITPTYQGAVSFWPLLSETGASSVGFAASKQISASALGRFAALAHAPGVTAHSGPYPVAWPVLRANGITADAMAEGRDEAPAEVDQPKVIQGTWIRGGGVVVERAFADVLGVHIGDHVTLDGRRFRVTGIGVTAAVPGFSQVCFYGGATVRAPSTPAWSGLRTRPAHSLATPGNPLTYYLNLRLKDPAGGSGVRERAPAAPHVGPGRADGMAERSWRQPDQDEKTPRFQGNRAPWCRSVKAWTT